MFFYSKIFKHFSGTFIVSKAYDPVFVMFLFILSYFIRLYTFNLNFLIIIKRTTRMNRNKTDSGSAYTHSSCILGNRLLALSVLCIMVVSVFHSGNGGLLMQLNWNRLRELMHVQESF